MPRTALVTGGASGLGAATAARLRAEGLVVTTLDVSGPADVIADVTDEAVLRRTAAGIGPVDVLINSASRSSAARSVRSSGGPSFVDRFGPFARAAGDLWPARAITGDPPSS